MSIDFLRADEPSIRGEVAYRAIGALAAALLDEDCLAAYCPETGQLVLWQCRAWPASAERRGESCT